jgi:hypothetical protein
MGKQVKPQTVVIGFAPPRKRLTLTAQDPMQLKEIGAAIRTHRTACRVKNGVAEEINQCDNSMKKPKTKAAKQAKVKKVMGEYKSGTLHSGRDPKGPKKAPVVKNRKQAVAIALNSAGISKRK